MAFKANLWEWGLEQFEGAFDEEGITDESFPLIDDETIHKIFPKMGPRLIFKKKFYSYFSQKNTDGFQNAESILTLPSNLSSNIVKIIPRSSLNIINSPSTSQESASLTPHSTDESYDLLDILEEVKVNVSSDTATEICDEGPSQNKKSKLQSVFSEGLEGVLKKYTDGQIVLLNRTKLNNDSRQKLVKVIVNEVISSQGTEVRASTFLRIREEIEAVFPNETGESYYIPYVSGGKNKKGTGPKGKLWSRYVNVKAALRIANAEKVYSGDSHSPEVLDTSEETSFMNFLNNAVEPQQKVQQAWEETFKIRKRQCLNVDLQEMFEKFPCLKLNYGIELIESDFNQRFADKIDIIYSKWPKVATAILKEADERNVRYPEKADITVQALLTLPFLFSPVTLKKNRKGGVWRPTRTEIQESFILPVNTFGDIEARLSNRKEKLKQFDITLQPLAVIVGNPETPDGFYIIVDSIYYKVDSPIRTLELLFKLYHALDVEYPIESEHIWLFIEELVFEIKPKKKIPSTESVISDIKPHLTT